MKSLIVLSAALAAAALAAPAFAAPEASVGYSNFDIGSTNIGAITLRGGWNQDASQSIGVGVEGEASFGLNSDTSGTGASRNSAKLSSEYGAFGTVTANPSDNVSLFARVGVANIDVKTTSGTGTTAIRKSYSESGLAYGAGASVAFDGSNGVRFDYTHYDVDLGHAKAVGTTPAVKGEDANLWSLSFVHKYK